MIKRAGPLEWVYDECRDISRIAFRFKEKMSPSSFASKVAGNMQKFTAKDVIRGQYLMEEFDVEVIENAMSYLVPENLMYLANNIGSLYKLLIAKQKIGKSVVGMDQSLRLFHVMLHCSKAWNLYLLIPN